MNDRQRAKRILEQHDGRVLAYARKAYASYVDGRGCAEERETGKREKAFVPWERLAPGAQHAWLHVIEDAGAAIVADTANDFREAASSNVERVKARFAQLVSEGAPAEEALTQACTMVAAEAESFSLTLMDVLADQREGR